MLYTPLPDTLDQLLVDAGPPRTPGLHLSTIIRSICASLEPGKYAPGPVNPLYTEPGFTFERVMEHAWTTRRTDIVRPGEFERDGILCSPDGIEFEGGEGILSEIKFTDMSSEGFPLAPKFRKWVWQMGAYCYVLELGRARLYPFFARGDYKKARRQYLPIEIRWESGETERIWALLVGHAREKGWLS